MSTKIAFRNELGKPLRWNVTDSGGKKNLASGIVSGNLATATVSGYSAYIAHFWPRDSKEFSMSSETITADSIITLSIETKPLGAQA